MRNIVSKKVRELRENKICQKDSVNKGIRERERERERKILKRENGSEGKEKRRERERERVKSTNYFSSSFFPEFQIEY